MQVDGDQLWAACQLHELRVGGPQGGMAGRQALQSGPRKGGRAEVDVAAVDAQVGEVGQGGEGAGQGWADGEVDEGEATQTGGEAGEGCRIVEGLT